MSTARLTLEITHPSEKGVHQELLQYEFPINKDGNWVQSLLEYISNKKEEDEIVSPKIIIPKEKKNGKRKKL
jgi:hypothetical protein